MSEDSDKEDPHFSNSTSEEVESDEDSFIQFVPEDIQQFECSDATCDPYAQRSTQIVFEYQSGRRVRRLREPRSLYGVFSTNSIPIARWPYECEVIEERVLHIEYYPPNPEPIYRATGLEREPPYVDPGLGRIVYLANEANKAPYFICSRVGGNRHIPLVATPVPREVSSNSLIFEARFESGNLQKVVQVGDYSYQLTLRSDLYTDRHTQWYYFRVQNTKAGLPYRFTIVNFAKSSSLYNVGMRPLMYSELEAASHKVGWKRVGDEIKYYRNGLEQDRQQHYSLSWTFKFQHHKDTCYFAHCYPYTYSNLQRYLADIANDPERSKFCKIRVLCHSLARNMVYVLTITNPSKSIEELKHKRAVIVTARVHPGETNSSWMMKGFLDYILSSKKDACLLRDHFIFKVVPMLNPDGVIVGNYRCSLSGRDLNRNYRSILKDSFPSVWYTCNMIKRIKNEREVLLYCDLHGHSRKQNIFMYGCGTRGQPETMRLKERVFPLILHKNCPDKFSFLSCKFKVQRSKEGTGRVVMWRMGISNSYTMEATFCGSTLGRRRGSHFSTKDLESMGYHFCDALLDYCDPDQSKYHHCFKELEEMVKHSKGRLGKALSDTEATPVDGEWDQESSTEGSDSSESNDLPAHLLDLASKGKFRKKRLKSKKERNSCFVHLEMTNDDLTEQSQSPQGNITPSEKKPTSGKVLPKLGSKNAHAHYREKFDVLQRLPINPISNLPRRSFLNDFSSKKVSVIYLLFNSHGHVITSQSHSNFQKEGLRQVTHGLKEFSWSTPQHLMPSLPSDSIIVPASTNHSTVSQSSYYIEANAEDLDECTPCMHEEQCEPREEVNTNRCKRVQKSAVSSLPPTGKHSGTVRRPLRDSHFKKDPVPTLLSKQSFRDLLHPRRTYASTPIYSAKTEDWQKSPGHRRNKKNQPKQQNPIMLLKNLNERAELREAAHRELTTKILENLELSLPILPAVSTGRRKVQMTSPNALNEVVTAAISSQLSRLSHRDIEGWSPRQSYASASSHQQQKPSRGDTHHPGRAGDEAKWSNVEVFTPVTKYTKLPPGTWKSVLPRQETESALRTEASNNPLPGILAQFNEQ